MNHKYDWLISDVDGILTNGGHYYTKKGKILKKFGSNDRAALKSLNSIHVKNIVFITSDKNGYEISKKRIVDELGYELFFVREETRKDFVKKLKGTKIYLGDGIHESDCFKEVELSFSLLNSTPQAKRSSTHILQTEGGVNVFSYLLMFLQTHEKINSFKKDVKQFYSCEKDLKGILTELTKIEEREKEITLFCNEIVSAYTGKNKIVFCGVGKNALLAEMICEFLHPYNIVSVVLDPHRAVHGNLGVLEKDDILILSSKSGNTTELVYLMKALERKMKIDNTFLITSNENCGLGSFEFKDILVVKVYNEISRFGHSPQTTILAYATIMFLIVNALAYSKEITEKEYLLNHQAGEIGKLFDKKG